MLDWGLCKKMNCKGVFSFRSFRERRLQHLLMERSWNGGEKSTISAHHPSPDIHVTCVVLSWLAEPWMEEDHTDTHLRKWQDQEESGLRFSSSYKRGRISWWRKDLQWGLWRGWSGMRKGIREWGTFCPRRCLLLCTDNGSSPLFEELLCSKLFYLDGLV